MKRFRPDPAEVRAGVLGQLARIDELVARLTPEDFDRPSRLGDWRVAEVVAHLTRAHIAAYLTGQPAPRAEVDVIRWAEGAPTIADRIDEDARAAADEARPAELRSAIARLHAQVASALAGRLDEGLVVPARFGAIGAVDYLATRCVELTVHTLDICAAVETSPELDAAAERVAVRLLAHLLEARVPGRSVELRVPPYVAVQVGPEGPRHTRGTPGSVVETDAVTWLELATGRLTWAGARATGRLSASGEHADLSAALPVLS